MQLTTQISRGFRKLAIFRRSRDVSSIGRKVRFQCNICGAFCSVPAAELQREVASCGRCGSTVRTRAIAHLLTTELFGRSLIIAELTRRRDLAGIGLSDSENYAKRLSDKFNYTNTFFHQEPRLDIAAAPEDLVRRFDFIIASDVFEHVRHTVLSGRNHGRFQWWRTPLWLDSADRGLKHGPYCTATVLYDEAS